MTNYNAPVQLDLDFQEKSPTPKYVRPHAPYSNIVVPESLLMPEDWIFNPATMTELMEKNGSSR